MSVTRDKGQNNREGALTPNHSVWGQEIRASTPRLIAQEVPIGQQSRGFHGNVGAMLTRSANVQALVADGGYFGDVPVSQQDMVQAPPPWNRS